MSVISYCPVGDTEMWETSVYVHAHYSDRTADVGETAEIGTTGNSDSWVTPKTVTRLFPHVIREH